MDRYEFGAFCGLMVVVAALAWLLNAMAAYACHAQWPDAYMPKYSLLTGCSVLIEGQRISTENVRVNVRGN